MKWTNSDSDRCGIRSLPKTNASRVTGNRGIQQKHDQGDQQDHRNRLKQSSQSIGKQENSRTYP